MSFRRFGNLRRPAGAKKGKTRPLFPHPLSTGYASARHAAAPLHPWLHPAAPLGRKDEDEEPASFHLTMLFRRTRLRCGIAVSCPYNTPRSVCQACEHLFQPQVYLTTSAFVNTIRRHRRIGWNRKSGQPPKGATGNSPWREPWVGKTGPQHSFLFLFEPRKGR